MTWFILFCFSFSFFFHFAVNELIIIVLLYGLFKKKKIMLLYENGARKKGP